MLVKRCLSAAILVLFVAVSCVYAQQKPAEATASVPALDNFHEVIFKIWHEAWPKKDTAMLRRLLPDVEKGISEVAAAPLPGILREKKGAWDEGVKKLQAIGVEYKTAAAGNNDPAFLAAAERLHSQFEALMRTIRPPLRELDDFHAVLYMLYHHYVPEYRIQNIRSAAMELKQKMSALNAAQLPERMKEPEFQSAKEKLSASVDALEASVKTNSEPKIKEAVETVHSNYQALERIFE